MQQPFYEFKILQPSSRTQKKAKHKPCYLYETWKCLSKQLGDKLHRHLQMYARRSNSTNSDGQSIHNRTPSTKAAEVEASNSHLPATSRQR